MRRPHPGRVSRHHPRRGEHPAMGRQRLPDDLTARRAGLVISAVTLSVAIVAGLLIRSFDHEAFPTVGSGLWWAVQTVTTVGYGDKVPTSTEGRLVAAVVMISGLGFMTVLTASISALFVESARRRRSRRDDASLEQIADRLDEIERRLAALMHDGLEHDHQRADQHHGGGLEEREAEPIPGQPRRAEAVEADQREP
jgi:voltage-gated potassium channel